MATLDMFIAPKEHAPPVQIRGKMAERPTEKDILAIVHLEYDDYREAYRSWMKARNGFKMNPDRNAWRLWHRTHDRAAAVRGH